VGGWCAESRRAEGDDTENRTGTTEKESNVNLTRDEKEIRAIIFALERQLYFVKHRCISLIILVARSTLTLLLQKIGGEKRSWRNSQLYCVCLFVSVTLTLSILKCEVVVVKSGRGGGEGGGGEENETLQVESKPLQLNGAHKRILPLDEQFRLDKGKHTSDIGSSCVVNVGLMLFSPHPTVEKYWPFSLDDDRGKSFCWLQSAVYHSHNVSHFCRYNKPLNACTET